MPTGYTGDLYGGEVEFTTFAKTCARAFGALMILRDDPFNKEWSVDDLEEDTSYTEKWIKSIEEDIEELTVADDVLKMRLTVEYNEELAGYEKRKAESEERLGRYQAMIEKVNAWEPPSEDHVALKTFMIQQLEESIRFDCHDYSDYPAPKMVEDVAAYREMRIASLKDSLERRKKDREEDIALSNERKEWAQKLLESLGETQ